MAKRQAVSHVEPDEISQDVPDEVPARVLDEDDAPETNGQAGASKTDLIREAVQAGYEKPSLGVAYIREKHGVEVDSKYYSIVKGKLGKSPTKTARPAPKSTPEQTADRTEQALAPTGTVPAGLFDDLKQIREMKDRYGDDFQKIVDAIG